MTMKNRQTYDIPCPGMSGMPGAPVGHPWRRSKKVRAEVPSTQPTVTIKRRRAYVIDSQGARTEPTQEI